MEEWDQDFSREFENFRSLYQEKKDILTENLNEDQTQDNFIDPVLRKLGHDWVTEASKRVGSQTDGKQLNPDYAFMNSSDKLKVHRDNEEPLDINYAVGDAKAWNRTLDKSTQDHTNPAFQIYNYVDRLRSDWGILTNGRKWRLYSYEKCAADIYFEIDLTKLLQGEKTDEKLETFKYFYLFFRADSFDVEGKSFLEKVYRQSVEYSEGLEDDLEGKVYDALEVTVKGFFDTNDLEKTVENIELVHRSSLIFLYRTLFILNAESRDLLPTEDEAYRQAFGLTQLKKMIVDEEDDALFQDTTVAWDNRLSRLFEGIAEGYELHESEIPAYNGGLFDEENGEENKFLAENKLYGSYIKDVLKLLATNYDEEKEQRVILDYKDLNIRHLGSVYEGLLEHEFKPADEKLILEKGEWVSATDSKKDWNEVEEDKRVEENELYLTNESGERKATGSYYTPEYIVEYIVENTVGPKVEEKIQEAEENGDNVLPKILELNVCDPAMGSGHFLTHATEFIAEKIVENADLKKQDIDEGEDELNWAKRQVVQNCIYGVDINPLAVELGKLSLWIETMAEGKPLNFLDHHLKHGNSLIGSDFEEILSHPSEDQKRLDSDRYKFGNPQEIKENFQRQYLKIEEMPENTVEQIHKKEQAYKEFISNNTAYQQFQQLANIHTRQYFEDEANSSDYESFLINIGNPGNPFEDEEFFQNAQEDAENRSYFHWQLEFPKVFFGEQKGFDAVVGNPPYVSMSTSGSNSVRDYLKIKYNSTKGKFDLYAPFIEMSKEHINQNGMASMIVSDKFLTTKYGTELKSEMIEDLNKLVTFGKYQVFKGIGVNTAIFFLGSDNSKRWKWIHKGEGPPTPVEGGNYETKELTRDLDTEEPWRFFSIDFDLFENLSEDNRVLPMEEASRTISKGLWTGARDLYVDLITKHEELHSENIIRDVVDARNLNKYGELNSSSKILYPYTLINGSPELADIDNYPKIKEVISQHKKKFENRKAWGQTAKEADIEWYEYFIEDNFLDETRIITPDIATDPRFVIDREGEKIVLDTCYIIIPEYSNPDILLALLNSKMTEAFIAHKSSDLGGKARRYKTGYLKNIPVIKSESLSQSRINKVENKVSEITDKTSALQDIPLDIEDYLGNYSDGKTLGDLYNPVEGLSDRVVSDTSADCDSLRIGGVEFDESNDDLILKVSARYKPKDSKNISEDELDRWGYFETSKVPAMKFAGLSKEMKSLIQEFTKLAVDEAGGFANFRESATKTNSVIDRLERLTLPKLDDVEQGLEKFVENKKKAKELEEEIQETDQLIDAIVFDLYDLTEEEVETVLDSLDSSEDEKRRILDKFNSL